MENALQLTLFDYKKKSLPELEGIIQRGMATFIEVGLSLLAIREGKKYRELGYTDFEVYMEERWGIGKSYGWRLLNAGYIGSEISTLVEKIPTHETQVKPLTRLGNWKEPAPEKWVEAWEAACDLAGETQQPTEKEVKYVVDQMLYVEPPPIPTGEYRIIQSICECEEEKYPNGEGRNMVAKFVRDCCNVDDYDQLAKIYKIPVRNGRNIVDTNGAKLL